MDNIKIIIISLIVLGILFSVYFIGSEELEEPEVRSIDNSWGEISSNITEIKTKIRVKNPNQVSLPIKNITYKFYLADVEMGSGSSIGNNKINADTVGTLNLSTKMKNNKIRDWWIKHIRNNEKSQARISGDLVFDLRVTDYKYPINRTRTINTDIISKLDQDEVEVVSFGSYSIKITEMNGTWKEVTQEKTTIDYRFTVQNNTPIPIVVTRLEFLMDMNDLKMATATTKETHLIWPSAEEEFKMNVKIDNTKLGEWWYRHLENGEKTEINTKVNSFIEAGNQEYKLTITEKTDTIETNILE